MNITTETVETIVVIPEQRVFGNANSHHLCLTDEEVAKLYAYINGTEYSNPQNPELEEEVNRFGWDLFHALRKLDFEPFE